MIPDALIMARSRGLRPWRAFVFCASVLAPILASALGVASTSAHASQATVAFDIPAQPLADALDAYSAATELELLYDSAIVGQLRSTAVHGEFTPADALRLLLGDTALMARAIAEDAVTIEVPSQLRVNHHLEPAPEKSAHHKYYALIQSVLARALCTDDQLRPGGYRAVLSFTIGGNGQIVGSRVVGTTGSDGLDRMIVHALNRMELGRPPPPGLQQPIMMIVLPQSSGMVLDCASIR